MRKRKLNKKSKGFNQENKSNKSMKDKFGKKLTSPEMSLNFNQGENDFYSAVIEFYGVDTTGPSYEGRIFLNNPKADGNTPLNETSGYVGSYHIFGHDGCWGDEGHCEPPDRSIYDSRLQTNVTPAYKYIDATKAIKRLMKSEPDLSKCTVTIVPRVGRDQRMSDAKDVVYIDRIRINCYEIALKLKS